MEMDKLGVVTTFVHNIVVYNIPLLYGTVGEIVVEKSGSLNLGDVYKRQIIGRKHRGAEKNP